MNNNANNVSNSQGFLFNSGQACIAASRLFVQASIADKFIEGLKAHFEGASTAMGDPSAPSTGLGPLADTKQLERVLGFIEAGKSEAKLLVGGGREGGIGAFVQPTIFLNPAKEGTIYKEEIFGPVLSVLTFETEEEAVKLANDTSFGLSGMYSDVLPESFRLVWSVLTMEQRLFTRAALPERFGLRRRSRRALLLLTERICRITTSRSVGTS